MRILSVGIVRASDDSCSNAGPQTGEISVQLVIHTAAPKADFRQLFAQKEQIEVEAKEQFEWREAPEKVQKRIELRRRALSTC